MGVNFTAKGKAKGFDLANYQPLPVVYQLRYSILNKVKNGEDPLPDIQGRESVKRDVLIALLSGANPYLVSEEGTGKTRLAKSLTKLLLPIPVIRGCPYNDDPKWPPRLLCPRCRNTKDPVKKFGIEIVPGFKRFSRVQGNEYTNEAKLLGLKDIQAIAQGKSPSDPRVFTGTGIFRANRGILFIDELPAIRTKVQVILHPVLEEKKAILEEYNWEHPLDLVLIATGNPQGFSHVNEVPRPLLDRLELIYMDLPAKEVEEEIMLKEKFKIEIETQVSEEDGLPLYPAIDELDRKSIVPWWIMELINETVRQSRVSPLLERKASIRATIRALDHTYGSVELDGRRVASLKDAATGLSLALRGRMALRADLVDFDNPKESLRKSDELSEYLLCKSIESFPYRIEVEKDRFSEELDSILKDDFTHITERLKFYPEVLRAVEEIKRVAKDKINDDWNKNEKEIVLFPEKVDEKTLDEYNYSALELVANLAWHRNLASRSIEQRFFVPRMGSFQKR